MTRLVQWLLLGAAVVAVLIVFGGNADTSLRPPGKRQQLDSFRLAAIGGPEWSLEDQRGSVVLLNFWATWCPPCRAETPDLVTLQQTYGPRGLRIVGISMDDDPAKVVPPFAAEYRIPYPMLIANENMPFGGAIAALPTSMLVDAQGRVARRYRGLHTAEEFAPDIERLLAERQ